MCYSPGAEGRQSNTTSPGLREKPDEDEKLSENDRRGTSVLSLNANQDRLSNRDHPVHD